MLAAAQLMFDTLAFHELSDLTAQIVEHTVDVRIRLTDPPAEELGDADRLPGEADRKTEGPV